MAMFWRSISNNRQFSRNVVVPVSALPNPPASEQAAWCTTEWSPTGAITPLVSDDRAMGATDIEEWDPTNHVSATDGDCRHQAVACEHYMLPLVRFKTLDAALRFAEGFPNRAIHDASRGGGGVMLVLSSAVVRVYAHVRLRYVLTIDGALFKPSRGLRGLPQVVASTSGKLIKDARNLADIVRAQSHPQNMPRRRIVPGLRHLETWIPEWLSFPVACTSYDDSVTMRYGCTQYDLRRPKSGGADNGGGGGGGMMSRGATRPDPVRVDVCAGGGVYYTCQWDTSRPKQWLSNIIAFMTADPAMLDYFHLSATHHQRALRPWPFDGGGDSTAAAGVHEALHKSVLSVPFTLESSTLDGWRVSALAVQSMPAPGSDPSRLRRWGDAVVTWRRTSALRRRRSCRTSGASVVLSRGARVTPAEPGLLET